MERFHDFLLIKFHQIIKHLIKLNDLIIIFHLMHHMKFDLEKFNLEKSYLKSLNF
jgi:hypothetical protein